MRLSTPLKWPFRNSRKEDWATNTYPRIPQLRPVIPENTKPKSPSENQYKKNVMQIKVVGENNIEKWKVFGIMSGLRWVKIENKYIDYWSRWKNEDW